MIYTKDDITPEKLTEEMRRIARRLKVEDIDDAMYFPRFFLIETVRACNARCPFCTVDEWDTSEPFMTDALFDKIATELIEYADWVFYVYLQKSGEPLLDKKIAQRIARLKQGGIKRINISTNVSLLDEQKGRELIEAGLDEIMFSIDTVDPEKYVEMRPGLDYDQVVGNIRTFFRLRDEMRPEMIIRVRGIAFMDWDSEEGQVELASWENFWNALKKPQDRIYMKKPHTWGNQKSWEGHTPDYVDVYHPCILPWSTLNVNSDGKVPLCGQDYAAKIQLGDVNRQSMKEIWQGQNWNRIRQLHCSGERNQLSFCQQCQLFDETHTLEKDRPELPV